MKFKILSYNPCCALQPFVNCYCSMTGNRRDDWQQILVPGNRRSIGFIFSGFMSVVSAGDWQVSRSFVAGQLERPATILFGKDLDMIVVFFTPTGMYRLFGIPMQQFTDGTMDLESVCNRQDIGKVFGCGTTAQRLSAIETLLLAKFEVTPSRLLERIAHASDLILDKDGTIPVQQLAKEVNMSRRNLERHFIGHVGVSPKSFSGISRINKILRLKEATPQRPWKDMAHTLAYTDQAHFIHEFKKFTGRTPHEYSRQVTDLDLFLHTV